jgi:hypothetical protein
MPGNLNHDGPNEGEQKAGHLRMSRPDNLPRPNTQAPDPTAVPKQEELKVPFRVFKLQTALSWFVPLAVQAKGL